MNALAKARAFRASRASDLTTLVGSACDGLDRRRAHRECDDLGRRHHCVAIATDLSGAELQLALLYYAILFFAMLFYSLAFDHPIDHPIEHPIDHLNDHLNDLNPFFKPQFYFGIYGQISFTQRIFQSSSNNKQG